MLARQLRDNAPGLLRGESFKNHQRANSTMRIAILGTRGIPASYGGFETFAEHLSTRLVARGHQVTVYCRAHYVSPRQLEFHGVRLEVLPTIRHKYFDTVVHAFLSALPSNLTRWISLYWTHGDHPAGGCDLLNWIQSLDNDTDGSCHA